MVKLLLIQTFIMKNSCTRKKKQTLADYKQVKEIKERSFKVTS